MPRKQDPQKKQRILDLAIESFRSKGFKDTSIKNIADSARVAPGTVYTYFKDKRELYYACINEIWNKFFVDLEICFKESPNIHEAIIRGHNLASNNIWKSQILVYDMLTNKIRREILKSNLSKIARNLTNYLTNQSHKSNLSSGDDNLLTQKIEIFLFGAFFQLAFSERDDFNVTKDMQLKALVSIISGES